MARELMLLVATVIVCLAPGIHGTSHLSFAPGLQVNVSRTGCGETKLCVETPDDCDPAGTSNCTFTSIMVHANTSMPYLHVGLSGMSTGYVAMGLTMNGSMNTMVFVCAQDNGTFFFRTMLLQNGSTTLTPAETVVKMIRGSVTNGSMIQCEFRIPRDSNASSSNVAVVLGSGTTNGTTLGAFTTVLRTAPLDLSDPTSNVNATVAPTPMSAASAPAPAVLFLLSALMLPVVLRT